MALIKAIKFLGWKFLRVPMNANESEPLAWPGGFDGVAGGGITEEQAKNQFINSNASTYALDSIEECFQDSSAMLRKVYGEDKLPTTSAYTVFSLGWSYGDNNNSPALFAVELATGHLYYYFGTYEDCEPSKWQELVMA